MCFQCKIFILTFKISVCGITFRFLSLGTEFMARLHEHLKYFVNMKISTDKSWQAVTVYLSGHEVNFYINKDFFKLILNITIFTNLFFFSFRHLEKGNIKLWNLSGQRKQRLIMIQTHGIVCMV